ncbi:aldose 1-epimerase [Nocardioides scoriae]|uniref:Aldose 1-epimerase n=1 Tax=Nocardioides scoriae TaxID=642780 RepID=A0A1H1W7Z7_9ACTN|nr:aldose epimerase family protein [Nocardioides scoriae]SDS93204.1 aldose 1-epimerase [Nocardioides scoriae]
MPTQPFGPSPLGDVTAIVLGHAPGPVLELLDLGATVHRLWVTGGDGTRRDVVLGHPDPAAMLASTSYLGGTIGRYANRVAAGRFELDGRPVEVGTHDRGQHLHGGPDGFDRRIWTLVEHDDHHAVLTLTSPDGDQGFPGEVTVSARFDVGDDEVRLTLEATTDAPTPVNLTSHVYLNLDGEGSGTIDDQVLEVDAPAYVGIDATGIPLPGPPTPVDGTPFDLRQPRRLGDVVRLDHPQLRGAGGIDHNYVLAPGDGTVRPVATLDSPRTRTRLVLSTDQPGLQVYTGNGLDGTEQSSTGGWHRQGDGLALEPQLFPDTPNRPDFGDATLRPGQTYRCHVGWRFEALGP